MLSHIWNPRKLRSFLGLVMARVKSIAWPISGVVAGGSGSEGGGLRLCG
jgi:hypothetical protein